MDILLTIKNHNYLNRLEKYGEVTFISKYTNTVGMKCTEENYHELRSKDWVFNCHKAATGKLLNSIG